MNNQPLVSIIIPTYSRSKYLKRAIDSCLKQTYQKIEILVIDDNGLDSFNQKETEKLIKTSYEHELKVKYIAMEKNSGACLARNRGIEISKGEYITFLDDDDEYYNNNIEEEIDFITKYNYEMIFCDIEFYNDITNERIKRKYVVDFPMTYNNLLKRQLLSGFSGGITYMYKSSVLQKLGGWENLYSSQDYVMLLKTIGEKYKVGYFPFIGSIAHIVESENKITGSLKAIQGKKQSRKYKKKYMYILSKSEKRRMNYNYYTFLYRQYHKFKDLRFIFWGAVKLFYLDMILEDKRGINEKKPKNVIYFK